MYRLRPRPALWQSARALSLVALLLVGACTPKQAPQLTLQVGPDQIIRFNPTSGYAHYVEIPGQGELLRIVLASYSVACQKYVPPSEGQVYVSVTIGAPEGGALKDTPFAWDGTIPTLYGTAASTPPKTKTPLLPNTGWALPYIRLAKDARALPPGGHVKLTQFSREPYGIIEGEFQFSDAGDGEAASSALLGAFRVQLCHLDLDPSRLATPDEEPRKAK